MVIIYLYPFFCFQRGSKLMTIIGTGGGLLLIDPGITQLGLERALEVTQPILLVMHAGELRPTGAMVIVSLCVLGSGERALRGSALFPAPMRHPFY